MNVAPFSFPPAFIGVGYGIPVPGGKPIKADPEQEYVAGGFGYLSRGIPQVLPWMVDDVTRDFGPQVYDAMHTDPFVGSTFRLLKMQILANDLQLIPGVLPSDQVKGDPEKKKWTPWRGQPAGTRRARSHPGSADTVG